MFSYCFWDYPVHWDSKTWKATRGSLLGLHWVISLLGWVWEVACLDEPGLQAWPGAGVDDVKLCCWDAEPRKQSLLGWAKDSCWLFSMWTQVWSFGLELKHTWDHTDCTYPCGHEILQTVCAAHNLHCCKPRYIMLIIILHSSILYCVRLQRPVIPTLLCQVPQKHTIWRWVHRG